MSAVSCGRVSHDKPLTDNQQWRKKLKKTTHFQYCCGLDLNSYPNTYETNTTDTDVHIARHTRRKERFER